MSATDFEGWALPVCPVFILIGAAPGCSFVANLTVSVRVFIVLKIIIGFHNFENDFEMIFPNFGKCQVVTCAESP